MKHLFSRTSFAGLAVALGLAVIPATSYAGRVVYHGPNRTYAVHYGNGWHGRGYYYGPAGAHYYYRTPGVVFYPTVAAVPATYTVVDTAPAQVSLEASVQIQLKKQGYYRGAVDGDIGSGSRAAISNYQANNGLKVTGTINNALLRSLGMN